MDLPEPILRIRQVSIALPGGADRRFAVRDVSLDLQPGEVHCVVGESGSGKSTLASAVMGLLPRGLRPSAGEILFSGADLLQATQRDLRAIRGRRISMIFQDPMSALNPCFRIEDQMREAFVAHGARVDRRRVADMLAAVRIGDPSRVLGAYPHQLSGGQRQRVMIATAMALDPEILIADEPTTALDVTTQAEILSLIDAMRRERGTGVLFITHDFGVVAEIADRVTVMQDGEIVEQGGAPNVLLSPREAYTRRLIAAIPRLSNVPVRAPRAAPALVEVADARKSYHVRHGALRSRTVEALRGVSLSVQPGRTLGIVGESGSGKSTLARCIVGLERLDAGAVTVSGVNVGRARGRDLRRLHRSVQMIFQDPFSSLDGRRTVAGILSEGPRNLGLSRDETARRVSELLERVGLSQSSLSRYPGEFSGGQRQRLCIARAVSMGPKLLIADEAVSALDVSVQRQVLDLFAELRRDLGIAMVFITHDVRVAAEVCDEVAVMLKGEVVESGRTCDVLGNPQVAYTRRLLDSVPGTRLIPTAFMEGDVGRTKPSALRSGIPPGTP